MNQLAGVYLHIPFCASRCHYCNFATGGYESDLAQRYVEALVAEIHRTEINPSQHQIDTIYFGGGTPSTLTIAQLDAILQACQQKFCLADQAEITIEANPGTIGRDYFCGLRQIGFNRISFGVQSFDDQELKMIDRVHTAAEARHTVEAARSAGFDNISIDLIAGLPEQKISTWRDNLYSTFALATPHISVYLLELYQDAPLLHRIKRGELAAIDEDLTIAMYYELVDAAAQHGYQHYEISNWSKPGFESHHNLKYWTGAPYHAFGVSAAGYDGMSRWANTRNIHKYLESITSHQSVVEDRTDLTPDEIQSEAIFLQLRLDQGVDLKKHLDSFGVDIETRYATEIRQLREANLLEIEGDRMRITRAGKILANEVFAAFI